MAILQRKPSATFIGQSTIKITNDVITGGGTGQYIPFITFAATVADAITGARPAIVTSTTTVVDTTAIKANLTYTIVSLGTNDTNWAAVGVTSPAVGATFTATHDGAALASGIAGTVSVTTSTTVPAKTVTYNNDDPLTQTQTNAIKYKNVTTGVPTVARKANTVYVNSPTEFKSSPDVTPQDDSGWELFAAFWGSKDTKDAAILATVDGTAGGSTTASSSVGLIIVDGTDLPGGTPATHLSESHIYTQVYRSLNADGITYKWLVLRYNTTKMEVNSTTCEYWLRPGDWDPKTGAIATRHTVQNEAFTYFDAAPVSYNLTDCDFLVMVSPRWCILHSFLNGPEPGLWSGVVESKREDVLDTPVANNPCWGWMASTLPMLGAKTLSGRPLGDTDHTLWSMPRVKNGQTGIDAAMKWGASYANTSHPHFLDTTKGVFIYYLGSRENRFINSGWDSSRKSAMPIKPLYDYAGSAMVNYGTIYGMKIMAPGGVNMDKVVAYVDSQGNSDPHGTRRYHWMLNHTFKLNADDNTTWAGNTTWGSSGYGQNQVRDVINVGCYYYIVTETATAGDTAPYGKGNKLVRVTSGTSETKDVFTVAAGQTITDVKFDGERYLYVSTTDTTKSIYRVDIAITDPQYSWSVITLTASVPSNGIKTIAITGRSVVAVEVGTASGTPGIRRVKRFEFVNPLSPGDTQWETGLLTKSPVVMNLSAVHSVADFNGDVWISCANGGTSTNNRLLKVAYLYDANGLIANQLQPTVIALPGLGFAADTVGDPGIAIDATHLQVLDDDYLVQYQVTNTGTGYTNGRVTFTQIDYNQIINSDLTTAGTADFVIPSAMKMGNEATSNAAIDGTTPASGNQKKLGVMPKFKSSCEKIDGILYFLPRSLTLPYSPGITLSLGTTDANNKKFLKGLTVGLDQQKLNGTSDRVLCGATVGSNLMYDGARIFTSGPAALKIFTNVHGGNSVGGAITSDCNLGQMICPC